MAFKDNLEILDGERLSKTAKATVQATGRLNFTPETAAMMNITAESTVVLFKAGERPWGYRETGRRPPWLQGQANWTIFLHPAAKLP